MELTANDISVLYSQIENKSNDEIEHIIKDNFEDTSLIGALFPDLGSVSGASIGGFAGVAGPTNSGPITKKGKANALLEICKEHITRYSSEIKLSLRNNPQKTNFVFDIIVLIAPAIAQQYSGLPAMAIVGSITLLCRQGIENYLK